MPVAAHTLAAAACLALGTVAGAQDSAVVRRVPALDLSRLAPFERRYDVIAYQGDSAVSIGTRHLRLDAGTHAGNSGWWLVERRTGSVAAVESLFVAPDVRPVLWSSWLGPARLAAVFVGDTIMGATAAGSFRQNLLVTGRPDLLVSGAMVELVLPLLPLAHGWRDSAAVLAATLTQRTVLPAELVLLGDEIVIMDALDERASRVIALRTENRSVLYWVDVRTGELLRMQQALPGHTGSLLEYRLRRADATQPTPSR